MNAPRVSESLRVGLHVLSIKAFSAKSEAELPPQAHASRPLGCCQEGAREKREATKERGKKGGEEGEGRSRRRRRNPTG